MTTLKPVTPVASSILRFAKAADKNQKDGIPAVLKLDQLRPNRDQARQHFDQESLEELSQSIASLGVLLPLMVFSLGDDQYEIIGGERRWRAARMAGLEEVPVLIKTSDPSKVAEIHMDENIHRENLITADLANRVLKDLSKPGASVDSVARAYKKPISYISKLANIARGGEVMQELVVEKVTADKEILSAVSSLERKSPKEARELVEVLKTTDPTKKRAVVTQHMKAKKIEAKKTAVKEGKTVKEPSWRVALATSQSLGVHSFIGVAISPLSEYASEFTELSRKFGKAHLATKHRHANPRYALVSFGKGDKTLRAYKADELQLICIDESK